MLSLFEQVLVLVGFVVLLLLISNYFVNLIKSMKVKGIIVHFFDPPSDISVLEVGYFYDNKMHFRDVLAWFIDLKNRGFVELKKHGDDVMVEVIREFETDIEIEKEFWSSLMRDRKSVSLNFLMKNYNTFLLPLTLKFIQDLRSKGYLIDSRKGGVFLAMIFGIAFWALGEMYLTDLHSGFLFLGLAFWGGFVVWAMWNTPRMTDKGMELYKKLAGFGNYLKVAETDREKFKQSLETRKSELEEELSGVSNLEFSDLLPYMVVLNVDKEWFETLIPELKDYVKGEGEIISVYKA